MEIKVLSIDEISSDLLKNFQHYQEINKKWVYYDNEWKLEEALEVRKWDEKKRVWVANYLREQVERGGYLVVALEGNLLVGFACIDGELLETTVKYVNLTMLFVDKEWKRKGIGKKLFQEICKCAIKMKAEKLYISAVSSFETVAFYFNMGCEDAKEVIENFVDTEQDRCMEYSLIKAMS